MGSTAQHGGFGLGGIVGQGAAVPGQASPTPDVATLSGQPQSATGSPDLQPSNQYAQIGNAFKTAAAGQQKQGHQNAGGMMGAPEVGGQPISLQQARAMSIRESSMGPCGTRASGASEEHRRFIRAAQTRRLGRAEPTSTPLHDG